MRSSTAPLTLLALLAACAPAHPGEAALLFGWDTVTGWYHPPLAGCSVEIGWSWTNLYGEEMQDTESFSWDSGGFREDARWEGGCRTAWESFTATCDGRGFPTEILRDGRPQITWKNRVRGGRLTRRVGEDAAGGRVVQDFTWEDGQLVAVAESRDDVHTIVEITRGEAGEVLSFTNTGVWFYLPADPWSEGTSVLDAQGRLTERTVESDGFPRVETFGYSGDEPRPSSGHQSYFGSSEADSSSYSKVYDWSCPPF